MTTSGETPQEDPRLQQFTADELEAHRLYEFEVDKSPLLGGKGELPGHETILDVGYVERVAYKMGKGYEETGLAIAKVRMGFKDTLVQ